MGLTVDPISGWVLTVEELKAVRDLERLRELVQRRRPEEAGGVSESEASWGRGKRAWFRMRGLLLDRWNLWPRLTKYRRWEGPQGARRIMPASARWGGLSKSSIERCRDISGKNRRRTSVGYWPGMEIIWGKMVVGL